MTEQPQQATQATGKENVGTLASITVLIVYYFPFFFVLVLCLGPLASPCKVAKQSSVLPRQQKPIGYIFLSCIKYGEQN